MAWMFVRSRACPVCGREMKIRGAYFVRETVNGKEEEAVDISYYCDGTKGSHHVDLMIKQGRNAMETTEVDEETVEDEYYEDEYYEDERENGNCEEERK